MHRFYFNSFSNTIIITHSPGGIASELYINDFAAVFGTREIDEVEVKVCL